MHLNIYFKKKNFQQSPLIYLTAIRVEKLSCRQADKNEWKQTEHSDQLVKWHREEKQTSK